MTTRQRFWQLAAFVALTTVPTVLRAQSTSPKDLSYWGKHFTLSGSARIRLESTLGSDFSPTPADAFVLSRVRLSLGYEPFSWFRGFAETQDSRVMAYQTIPSTSYADPFDLRQAYLEIGKREGPFSLRTGRQELTIGSGRMIASPEWGNVPKTFDVARGSIRYGAMNLDIAAGSVVLADSKRMDRHKPGEHFYVAYSKWSNILPGASVEPYFIAKTQLGVKSKDGKIGDADTLAAGLRVIGKLDWGLDYSAEAVHEMGAYANDSIRAWGTASQVGWTAAFLPRTPRFIAEYVFASGDSGKKDSAHQNFDFIYGLNQPMNSFTGQFSWKNLKEFRTGVAFNVIKPLKLTVDYRDYWLATTQDGLYNSAGTRTVMNALAKSGHVGDGIDATATYSFSKTVTLGVGVSNLFPGQYLVEAKKTSGFIYPFLYVSKKL